MGQEMGTLGEKAVSVAETAVNNSYLTVSRAWKIDPTTSDPHRHDVQLRHNTFSGDRIVLLDGAVVYQARKFLDDGDEISVSIGERAGVVKISYGVVFSYGFTLDGEFIPAQSMTAVQEDKVNLDIKVTAFKVTDQVVTYTIATRADVGDGKLGEKSVVHKRFSELDKLDTLVRSAYFDNHLSENIPEFPPKYNSFMTDHLTVEFCTTRKGEIERYLRLLSSLPGITNNPDFRTFLYPNLEMRRTAFQG